MKRKHHYRVFSLFSQSECGRLIHKFLSVFLLFNRVENSVSSFFQEIPLALLLLAATCSATVLQCSFKNDFVWKKYGCEVEEFKSDNRVVRITSIEGRHAMSKSNDDVLSLRLENIKTIEYFTSDFFVKFPFLQNLVIHQTSLKYLLRGDFAMAESLCNLHITHTELDELEDFVFHGTRMVKTLNLRDNKIREIAENAFKGMTTIKFLMLSHNEIHSLHLNLFKDLSALEQLSLGSNRIRHIDERMFSKNRNLQTIFLNNNQLKAINGKMFEHNRNLREIYMDNNFIKQISNVSEFLVNLKALEIATFNENVCVNSTILIMKQFYPPYQQIFKNC